MTHVLQDQIGAMALIDNLRRQEMQVNEHLDLPKRRSIIEAKIREYYKANGIEVDDKTIAQGVSDYFKSRLVFESSQLSSIGTLIARLYISRARWLKYFLITIGLIFSIVAVSQYKSALDATRDYESAQQIVTSNNNAIQSLRTRTADFSTQVKNIGDLLKENVVPIASTILKDVEIKLNHANAELRDLKLGEPVHKTNYSSISTLEKKKNERIVLISDQLAIIESLLSNTKNIIAAKGQIDAVAANNAYAKTLRLPEVKKKFDETNALFADTVLLNPIDIPARVIAFFDFFNAAMTIPTDVEALDSINSKFIALNMSKEDISSVNAIVNNARLMAEQLNSKNLKTLINDLESLYVYAKTPLTINIVDRQGIKSGVERQFNASKGKSWFLIAEALNDAGEIVPIRINNIETGQVSLASRFGVRVTQEQYQAAREEKRKTGHISDRKIGFKPENAISMTFNEAFRKHPDMITEW